MKRVIIGKYRSIFRVETLPDFSPEKTNAPNSSIYSLKLFLSDHHSFVSLSMSKAPNLIKKKKKIPTAYLVALDLQLSVLLAFSHLFPEPLHQMHSDQSVWLCCFSSKVELQGSLDRYCCLGEFKKKRQVNNDVEHNHVL